MGTINQVINKLMTTTMSGETPDNTNPENQTPEENEELSNIFSQLVSNGEDAKQISKGFASFKKKQKDDFKMRLEEAQSKEGEE